MRRRKPESDDPRDGLKGELERLGLSPRDAAPLADRLVRLAAELPEPEYRALVEGVVLGTRAGAGAGVSDQKAGIQNLLEDFTSELKKLDEGLKLLTAYISRLRDQTSAREGPRILH